MKRKVLLSIVLLSTVLLSGCGEAGVSFDIVTFLQNPFVMIIIAIFIVAWMWKQRGK